jgi:hypothetical protein
MTLAQQSFGGDNRFKLDDRFKDGSDSEEEEKEEEEDAEMAIDPSSAPGDHPEEANPTLWRNVRRFDPTSVDAVQHVVQVDEGELAALRQKKKDKREEAKAKKKAKAMPAPIKPMPELEKSLTFESQVRLRYRPTH